MLHLLLAIGLSLTPQASAADGVIDCKTLLSQEFAVSEYTKSVVKRIEEGKRNAAQGSEEGSEEFSYGRWQVAAILAAIDNYSRVFQEARSLTERTTCEQYDISVLECQLEDIRTKMNEAVKAKRYRSAYKLQTLYHFTNQRLRSVFVGARDPHYRDAGWGERNAFDKAEEVWCCVAQDASSQQGQCVKKPSKDCDDADTEGIPSTTLDACTDRGCTAPKGEKKDEKAICPFSTDYFPAGQDNYGCTEEILEKLGDFPGVKEEKEALKLIQESLKKFREKAKKLKDLENRMQKLLDLKPSPDPAPEEEEKKDPSKEESEHRVIQGCIVGECSNDASESCEKDSDCGDGVCRKGVQDCTEGGENCTLDTAPDFLAWELRGPFTVERDETKLLDIFSDKREREVRTFPDGLLFAGEKQEPEIPGQEPEKVTPDSLTERLNKVIRRDQVKANVKVQGRAEAELFARGSDPTLTMATAMESVRKAAKPLVKMAHEKTGLRQGVLHFAWFLRRTCLDRDCNERLERIMRIVNAEKCFPYANGEFEEQSCDSPVWKACLDEAEIKDIKPPELNCE